MSENPLVVSARFVREKKTKNKVRYVETSENGSPEVVGLIYISKSVVEELGDPGAIRIWVAAEGTEV